MRAEPDATWLDGNALAGLLGEMFGREMTTVDRRCEMCGGHSPIGAHRLFLGAGMVLRCPICDDVALRVTVVEDRHVVHLRGTWALDATQTL